MKTLLKKHAKRFGYFFGIAVASTIIGFSLQIVKA